MRVAVQSPRCVRTSPYRNFDGYNYAFVKSFTPIIYLPGWKATATRGFRWRRDMKMAGLDPDRFDFVFSERDLNRRADVLICFNHSACEPGNRPPKNFQGMKVWHLMDHSYRASECHTLLKARGVDYVLGYTDYSRYDLFFKKFFPSYIGKVIAVPFGFGERFKAETPFEERILKVVGLGAIHPVNRMEERPPQLLEYLSFFKDEAFSHPWRRMLHENSTKLTDIFVSFFPDYPEGQRRDGDPVSLLNSYALFANDECILQFPPARTYEGTASGAAMVSSDHECFRELGFVDGVNCIMHRPLDLGDFREKVQYYLERPDELKALAQRGCEMVRSRYTHEMVAQRLHEDILARWRGKA